MDIRKIKKLIELVEESGISELEISEGEESVRISRAAPAASFPVMQQAYAAPMMQQPTMTQQPRQNNNDFYDMKTVDLDKDFDDSVNSYDIMDDDIQF